MMAATLQPQQQNESKGRDRPASSSNGSMNPKISFGNKSSNSSAQSLVYWSHSNDDEAALDDDHGGFLEFSGRASSVGLDVDDESLSQSSSFADSLYYSEDGSSSRITGLVSFGSSSRDRDASFSSGTDRYFDEEEPDGSEDPDGGDLSSLDDNVYIFTDDDSLSPRDHRLAAHQSRMLVFRPCDDDDRLNPPSLLETPRHGGSTSNTGTPRIRPMPDTPSGIVTPSSWQEYNKRRGKQVARKLLSEASQNPQPKSTTGGGEPAAKKKTSPPSSPLKKSLWSRGSRSVQTQSKKETTHTTQQGSTADEVLNVDGSSNPASSLLYSHGSRRISLVGSWEDDDDAGDDDGSVRVLRCSEIDGLDARTPAHEIVERLDLGGDGRQLVDEIDAALSGAFIAKAADVVHMPPFPSSLSLIPFWPICNGTLWLPRYDLYVAQALRSSMTIVAT
jgi:hypothetical protein